jgi:hypothetical protein
MLAVLLAALAPALAETEAIAAPPPDGAVFGLVPFGVPTGVGVRLHVPVGEYGSAFVGSGVATGVFSVDDLPTRLSVEAGFDYYLGERYDSLFFGPRAGYAFWTSEPVIGGTNAHGGAVFGGRAGVGDRGMTVSMAFGFELHSYSDFRVVAGSDGLQVLPQLEIDLTLPRRR